MIFAMMDNNAKVYHPQYILDYTTDSQSRVIDMVFHLI